MINLKPLLSTNDKSSGLVTVFVKIIKGGTKLDGRVNETEETMKKDLKK